MSDDDVSALLPTSKIDTDRAEQIVARGYPAVAPIIPELLEWLKDYNWPVAQVLAPFLATIGAPLIPEIRRVLQTDDHVWKYWLISCLVTTREMASGLRADLLRLAEHPSQQEVAEELHILAREILDANR